MILIVKKVNCCLVIGWDKVGNTDVNLNSQKGDTNMFLLLPPVGSSSINVKEVGWSTKYPSNFP